MLSGIRSRSRRSHRATAALVALLAVACAPALAHIDTKPASQRPYCNPTGRPYELWLTFEADDTTCDEDPTDSGSATALCKCADGVWSSATGSGSGGSSNSFETIDTTSGTDPVADSATDTLTLTAGSGVTVTGDSSTDTVTIAATRDCLLDSDGDTKACVEAGGTNRFDLFLSATNTTPAFFHAAGLRVNVSDNTASSEDTGFQFGVMTGGVFAYDLNILGGEVLATNRLCVGTALGAEACIANDSDRLYHDTNANGTKDTGEEYIDQAGSGSTRDAALVYGSGTFSHNSSGGFLALTWDSEARDTNSLHSTSSNTDRITIQTAGLTLASCGIQWDSNTTGVRSLYIVHYTSGGSIIQRIATPTVAITASTRTSVTGTTEASVGDYLTCEAFQNSGGTRTISIDRASGGYFSAALVSP